MTLSVYSDASQTKVISSIDAEVFQLSTPGEPVTIANGKFKNMELSIIGASNLSMVNTVLTGTRFTGIADYLTFTNTNQTNVTWDKLIAKELKVKDSFIDATLKDYGLKDS